MKKALLEYLKNRHNVELLILGLTALAGLFILSVSPYQIHDWVQANKPFIFWSEIGILILMIGVLCRKVNHLNAVIIKLSDPTHKEMADVPEMYNFYDERGELKLSVKPEALYYLEAADNYVQIHYSNAGKMQTLMIRNTLKNIEWRFKGKELMRCHRSYVVNFSKIQLLRRQEGDVVLDFGDDRLPHIPVSKGYSNDILKRFTTSSPKGDL